MAFIKVWKFGSPVIQKAISIAMFLTVIAACSPVNKQKGDQKNVGLERDQHKTWMDFGGGPDQSKFVKEKEINKKNVNQLQVAWFYSSGDDNVYQFNPIVVDTIMYVLAKDNSLIALHAATGKEIWIHANLQGIAPRGINYWENKDRTDRRLLFQMNNYLQAIDAQTGKSILGFGINGLVDLREGLGRDPKTLTRAQSGTPGKIFENLLMLGSSTGESFISSPGHLRAYNVITGKLEWIFHTIPQPGEYGYDTWPKDAYKYVGGVNTWGEISVDVIKGIAYFPLGSPTYDYYGGDRPGNNLYGNCILALDARTGKRLWHYQVVHHDLWDYDLSAAPQLITVQHEEKKVDAVAVAGKTGFLYVFDRVSGKPLWPIEERPVPASDVPGEKASPTQPFPTVVPPFGRQTMTVADINPYFLTLKEREECKRKFDSLQTGLFTPVSMTRETVSIPGAVGGASWGSTAANPEKGLVYVRSIDWPSFYGKVEKREMAKPGAAINDMVQSGQGLYLSSCQACHKADHSGGIGPQLLDVQSRYDFAKFRQLMHAGKGEMPAFPHLDEDKVRSLYNYLRNDSSAMESARNVRPVDKKPIEVTGPVVAKGGAPGGQKLREVVRDSDVRQGPNEYGLPYPEGAEVPSTRYFIPPGWGLGSPYVISPPWSSIIAYDLNKGTIKWKIAVGQDEEAAKEGGKNTGVLRSQRHGMIVTSNGLLFCTSRDGKIYAFDADNGNELWAGKLPTGTQGLPSMYQLNGRHYIVVSATIPVSFGRSDGRSNPTEPPPQGGYVVYALPK